MYLKKGCIFAKEITTKKIEIMTTLIRTNEFGRKLQPKNYLTLEAAKNAASSFLNDCTIHSLDREKRSVEFI